MITSFFRPKGEASAAPDASSTAKRSADAAFETSKAGSSDSPSEPTGGAKGTQRC